MDTENRSILILFSCFVLLVFLDHQSATQLHRSGPGPSGAGAIERMRPDDLLRGKDGADDETARLPAGVDIDRPAVEVPAEAAAAISNTGSRNSVTPATESEDRIILPKLKLKEVSVRGEQQERRLVLPTKSAGGRDTTRMALFYPAFRGRQTVMVRVHRDVPGVIDPGGAVRWLQKGPTQREKGLVNALDETIPIERVEVSGGVATVHAGPAMNRMSAAILQDRLDQLRLTLAQFPGLREMHLAIDGQVVTRIGKGKDAVPVLGGLHEGLRSTEDYRDL